MSEYSEAGPVCHPPVGGERDPFGLQQRLLAGELRALPSAAESSQGEVGGHDPVAGHDRREGIAAEGLTHCPGATATHGLSQRRIGRDPTRGHLA